MSFLYGHIPNNTIMRKIKNLMKNKLSRDRRGGIEGLPLQLIIIIMVATIGTGIILGWVSNIENPKYIGGVTVDTENIRLVNGLADAECVKITVTDQDGNPLEGATVVLLGISVCNETGDTPVEITDSDGGAIFGGLQIVMKHSPIGYITVHVSEPEHGEHNNTRIPVIA